MDCSICCNSYTKTLRKKIECPYCNYTCCQVCLRSYLLTQQGEPDCLSCHKVFSQEHLIQRVGTHYLENVYRKHRESILFERERAMLPDTQVLVQPTIETRNLTEVNKQMETEIKEMKRKMREMENTYEQNKQHINTLKYYIQRGEEPPNTLTTQILKADRRIFIRPCPALECRGFLNKNYQCGTCHTKVCSKCHEITQEEHECHPDNVASAKAILKDTQPCPKCAVRIYKIDGCSQMWCSACKTAFDWTTGQIESGRIHNPHYYEWLRNRTDGNVPREQGDIPCGGIPDVWDLMSWIHTKHELAGHKFRCTEWNAYRASHKDFTQLENNILQIHRSITHIQITEMPRYNINNETNNTTELRIKYLLKELSDDDFRSQLYNREKLNNKKQALYQILELYVNASADIIRNYIMIPPQPDGPEKMYQELVELIQHCNQNIKRICQHYKCSVPQSIYLNTFN